MSPLNACVCTWVIDVGDFNSYLLPQLQLQRLTENKRSQLGVALGGEEAATRIQAAIRGKLWRNRVRREADNELQFIGMKPKVGCVWCVVCGAV
jgi:hypothetical protein